jgi:hypothetical protein
MNSRSLLDVVGQAEVKADTTWSGTLTSPQIAELEACLKIAMDQWAGWLDDCRGCTPGDSTMQPCDRKEWDRCKAVLEK